MVRGGAGGGRGTPLYGLYRFVQPQRPGFSAILVINRVSILAIFVIYMVWFLHSGPELGMFLEDATIDKTGQLKPYTMPLTSV